MKSAVAATLICALSAPSLVAAQQDGLWLSVHQLVPGSTLTLTRQGEPSHTVRFIFADDTELKALNVSGVDVPPAAAKVLIRMASEQPDQLLRVTPGTTLRIDEDVVLSASGLFAGDRKIADFDRVIESISRSDVETGVVHLEIPHRMSTSKKVLIGVGIVLLIPPVIYAITCTVGRCD